jgi:exosortase
MSWRRPASARPVLFCAYTAILLAVNAPALGALFDLTRHDRTASHIALVPFVTLAMMYQDRRIIFSSYRAAHVAGALTVLGGLALLLAGSQAEAAGVSDALSITTAGLVVAWVGGFLVSFGRVAFRTALFPLVFLSFTIPLPHFVILAATQALKDGSTHVVGWLFILTGTPFLREGYVFSLPTVAIEIADECSGIRSSIALTLTALLASHTFLRTGLSKLLLLAAVLPMTVLKNGIRIVSLSLLSMHVDPEFLTGHLHHEGGIVFFLLALALLAPVLVMLRRVESHARPALRDGDGPGRVIAAANAAARD